MNTELFKKIHDAIEADPAGFDMGAWEGLKDYEHPACGTTRCVAGWAVHFASGEGGLYIVGERTEWTPGVLALAERLGVRVGDVHIGSPVADLGAKVLGLERGDRKLFYTDGETAAGFVRLAAQGDDEAARAVLDHVDA